MSNRSRACQSHDRKGVGNPNCSRERAGIPSRDREGAVV